MVSPTCPTCSLVPKHSVGQDGQVRCGRSSGTLHMVGSGRTVDSQFPMVGPTCPTWYSDSGTI